MRAILDLYEKAEVLKNAQRDAAYGSPVSESDFGFEDGGCIEGIVDGVTQTPASGYPRGASAADTWSGRLVV